MIITCPHCQTRYQVAQEAIGSAGRKVQCASCNEAWQQDPPVSAAQLQTDKLQADVSEDGLDEAFSEEERAVAAAIARKVDAFGKAQEPEPNATIDPAVQRKRQRAFSRRQNSMVAKLPLARMRRAARIIGSLLLVGTMVVGIWARTKVVEQFPAMADFYEAVGLGVNVVGLDFSDLQTSRSVRQGKEVLIVSAKIIGLEQHEVLVPQVVVRLIGVEGTILYEWSVRPEVRALRAGESAEIKTELTLPPGHIAQVKLAFAGGGAKNNPGSTDVAVSPAPQADAGHEAEPVPDAEHGGPTDSAIASEPHAEPTTTH